MWKNREAQLCLFSVLLAFLPSASLLFGNSKYMVLVPSQLYTETPEKICLHLYHLNETVTVTASLISQRGTRKLFDEPVVDKDLFHCVSFTIPRLPSSEEEESLDINIEGAKHKFSKRHVVLVKNKESVVFVQTDKPMYKPGQSVKFRVVSMDKNLYPLKELFPLAYIEDPKMNRIMQWQDVKTENGLKQLSFSLSAEPIQGPYKIVVLKQSGVKEEHSFTVMEFVLPRFGVDVKVPNAISVYDEIISVTACATYTYGKPVLGRVKVRLCHGNPSFSSETKSACKEENSKLDNNGCSTQEVNITEFQLKENYLKVRQAFHVNATVTEEGTGSEFGGYGRIEVERTRNKFLFLKADSHFRHGIPFFVKVRLVDIKGDPIPNEQVFIKAQEAGYTNATTTDQHGLAKFSIDTSSISGYSLNIKVYHKEENLCIHSSCTAERHAEAHHTAYAVYSLSKSYIYLDTEAGVLPCNQIHTVQAHFILKGQVLGVLPQIVFHYLVMAQGSILQTGNHTHQVESGVLQGNFALEIPVEFSMVPMAKMLIYTILPDGEVIADSVKFQVEKCLRNKVHLSFSPSQSLPASQTHMRVTASPQSLCGLRAVDQSVLLLRPEAELSPSLIYDLPGMQDSNFIPRSHHPFEDEDDCLMYQPRDTEELTYSVPYGREKDVYRYVRDMGLTAFTNLKIKHPTYSNENPLPKEPPRKDPPRKDPEPKDTVVETIRNYFPETWVWDLVTVNSSGVTEVEMTVPDTITEWKAGALCLSNDTGLGLSSVATLQAFQPFFVELTMPYSVIRGEAFTLKDTVVALDALSKYGAATFSKSQKTPSVTVQSSGSFSQKFQVDKSNRLLLQQVSLPDIPGNYTIRVSGEGCVYAQTTLRYNLPLEKQQPAFALKVKTVPLTCNNPKGQNSFQISLEISYTGSRPASNMVIADVKMLSGFIPLKPTVKKLERLEHVSRTEVTTNNVLLYLDQVTNQTLSFSFIIQQDIPVKNLQPAIVKVYDYYETDEVAFAEYSSPCSSGKHLALLAQAFL
uniref:Murinoglobulin 2 n=1 Tax=Rattus norvegicus TaxID=10116 RepID=A0A8I5ZV18_RAT